jgi:hypothetical protein
MSGVKRLDVRWNHGPPSSKHNTDPDLQTYRYDEHTVILRQNKAIDYEAPFLFLLFGEQRVVLLEPAPPRRSSSSRCAEWSTDSSSRGSAGIRATTTSSWCCTPTVTTTTLPGTASSPTVQTPCSSRPTRTSPGRSSDSRPRGTTCAPSDAGAPPRGGHLLRPMDRHPVHRGHRLPGQALHRRLGGVLAQHRPAHRIHGHSPGHARHRMSHRDEPRGRRRLPGAHHLSARRASAGDDGRASARNSLRARRGRVGPEPARRAFDEFILWPEDDE